MEQHKLYRVLPEYWDAWVGGDDADYDAFRVDLTEIQRLAVEWDMTIEELMQQVTEI